LIICASNLFDERSYSTSPAAYPEPQAPLAVCVAADRLYTDVDPAAVKTQHLLKHLKKPIDGEKHHVTLAMAQSITSDFHGELVRGIILFATTVRTSCHVAE